jgi:hypothetical protein
MKKTEKLQVTQARVETYNTLYEDIKEVQELYNYALRDAWTRPLYGGRGGPLDELAKYGLVRKVSGLWETPAVYDWDWKVKDLNKQVYKNTKSYQEKIAQGELGL